jgi:hypothetical protein
MAVIAKRKQATFFTSTLFMKQHSGLGQYSLEKKALLNPYNLRSAHLESNITEFPLAFRLGVQG